MAIRAAGGVVRRRTPSGGIEVLLVHRPKYDDWTFPKGKADGEESDQDCALREVEEETGYRCRLGPRLEAARYRDPKGRPKVVHYFAMTPLDGAFTPNDEVDEIRWLEPVEASRLLTYEHDAALLDTEELAG